MSGFAQAVKERVSSVRQQMKQEMTWSNVKAHLTVDKIILLLMLVLLWGFSTVPLFLFYSTSPGAGQSQVLHSLDFLTLPRKTSEFGTKVN